MIKFYYSKVNKLNFSQNEKMKKILLINFLNSQLVNKFEVITALN